MGCKLTSAVGNLSAVNVSAIDPLTKLDMTKVEEISLGNAENTAATTAWIEWGENICTNGWRPIRMRRRTPSSLSSSTELGTT